MTYLILWCGLIIVIILNHVMINLTFIAVVADMISNPN